MAFLYLICKFLCWVAVGYFGMSIIIAIRDFLRCRDEHKF